MALSPLLTSLQGSQDSPIVTPLRSTALVVHVSILFAWNYICLSGQGCSLMNYRPWTHTPSWTEHEPDQGCIVILCHRQDQSVKGSNNSGNNCQPLSLLPPPSSSSSCKHLPFLYWLCKYWPQEYLCLMAAGYQWQWCWIEHIQGQGSSHRECGLPMWIDTAKLQRTCRAVQETQRKWFRDLSISNKPIRWPRAWLKWTNQELCMHKIQSWIPNFLQGWCEWARRGSCLQILESQQRRRNLGW